MPDYKYAEIAYEAYRKSSGGFSLVTGDPIPEFFQLPARIKDAWFDAAAAVIAVQKSLENESPDNGECHSDSNIRH